MHPSRGIASSQVVARPLDLIDYILLVLLSDADSVDARN